MKSPQVPTLGRIVHYNHARFKKDFAAIISGIGEDVENSVVDLSVFVNETEGGILHVIKGVKFRSEDGEPGTWFWPPIAK